MSQPTEDDKLQQLRARVDAFYASHTDELNPSLKRDKILLEEQERQAEQAEREKERRAAKRRERIKAIEDKLAQRVKPPPGLQIPDDDA